MPSNIYLLNMCDDVLVVLLGNADTLEVFNGDITDCIPAVFLFQCKQQQQKFNSEVSYLSKKLL